MVNNNSILPSNLAAIVAVGCDSAIGRNGDMPWHLPEDLKHFKEITSGATVIMGRKTWESLPRRPLPGRRNIVISRSCNFQEEGAEMASSLQEAIAMTDNAPAFIIGGESVYREALPLCSKLFLTQIEISTPDADTFFPSINPNEWQTIESTEVLTSKNGINYRFLTLERI